jgi:hypothetical protein
MNQKMFFKIRLYVTGIVTVAIWTILLWDHYHGGVPGHHILANEDLPEISNWWGGLVLPLLTWILLYRIQKRVIRHNNEKADTSTYLKYVLYGFGGALLFGILLAAFFTFGYPDISGYMVFALFPLALFFPIYRPECLLGFVIGMTYTFGGVLPTVVGSIFLLAGAVLYLLVRPGILYVVSKFTTITSSKK